MLGNIWAGGMALVNFLALLLITPVVTFYLLRDWDSMVARMDSWLPRAHAETIREQTRILDSTLSAFVRGTGMVCIILAVFYAATLSIAGLQFGLAIGLAAGILSFVPYLGSLGGLIICVGLAFLQFDEGWRIAVIAGIFIIGQLAEGMILTPKLVGDRIRLHPVWVIFAVLAGGTLFGFVGMLIALPVAAMLGVVIRFGVGQYLESKVYLGDEETAEPDEASETRQP
jgi:predicted PurR-regulated permease PerM